MAEHVHPNYTKVWAILCALLVVSVVGPLFGIRVVTLITAFGVAGVKAFLVAKHFMHINVERRWVPYLLLTMIAFMVVLFSGAAPDVMQHGGPNWKNVTAAPEGQR